MNNKLATIEISKIALLMFFCAWMPPIQAQQAADIYDPPGNLTAVAPASTGPPSIATQPQPQLIEGSSPVTLSVIATGTGLSYQWLSNGIPITGAIGDSLILTNLAFLNSTNFSVTVSNTSGTVTSSTIPIWVDSNGNGIPDWWEMKYFGNLNQTATGDYDGDGVDNMDEYLEGTDPTNPNSFNPRLYLYGFHGTASASPAQPYYTMGQIVTLTANADSCQDFLDWSGSLPTDKPVISLVMNGHKTMTANFGLFLPVALDNSNFTWTTGGNAAWYGQTEISKDGLGAAQSGALVCPLTASGVWTEQQSWLQTVTNLIQPMRLSFWWNVASQPPNGLVFSVDGTTCANISGAGGGWQSFQTNLLAGDHILTWTYSQYNGDNPANASYSDAGWVDAVTLAPLVSQANAPVLQIALTSTNTVLIFWPALSAGFILQQNTALAGSNWANVKNTVNVINNQNQVIVSPSGSNLFYRLLYQ